MPRTGTYGANFTCALIDQPHKRIEVIDLQPLALQPDRKPTLILDHFANGISVLYGLPTEPNVRARVRASV